MSHATLTGPLAGREADRRYRARLFQRGTSQLCATPDPPTLGTLDLSLFITCLTDTFYPRAGIAVVRVLEHLGCRVHFPQDQTCCGQPLYNNGFHDDARALARRMVDVFEPAERVVTPSGSCAAMIRDYYGPLLADDHAYAHGAEALVAKTFEFVEFLVKALNVDLKDLGVKWPGSATYHFSCHLRGLGVHPASTDAERLLKQIEGLDYSRMEKVEQCCGFGGTFAMKYPEISGSIVRDKVQCIQKTGAPTVVSNDAGCTMNISGACKRHGVDVGFVHIAEVIAEGLGLMDRP